MQDDHQVVQTPVTANLLIKDTVEACYPYNQPRAC